MSDRIKSEDAAYYLAAMYDGIDSSNATITATAMAFTHESIIARVVEMLQKEIGDDESGGNMPFFENCLESLKEKGFVLSESDSEDGQEWSVRLFKSLGPLET